MSFLRSLLSIGCCLTLTSCGPAIGDYADAIGSTTYEIVGTSSRSHWIFPTAACGDDCPVIPRDVVKFEHNDYVIAARRQVVVDGHCDDGTSSTESTRRYRQYVIVLSSRRLLGPFKVAEYEAFVASNPKLMRDVHLLGPADLSDGPAETESNGKCPATALERALNA